jgi:hypothetical protein
MGAALDLGCDATRDVPDHALDLSNTWQYRVACPRERHCDVDRLPAMEGTGGWLAEAQPAAETQNQIGPEGTLYSSRSAVPTLALGNAVVVKPAKRTRPSYALPSG